MSAVFRGFGISMGIAALLFLAAQASASGSAFVNCEAFSTHGGASYRPVAQPTTCIMQGLPVSGATEAKLSGLKWSGWGTSVATATGIYHDRHGIKKDGRLVFPVAPVRLALFGLKTGCDGRSYYTRVTFGEQVEHLSAACIEEEG